MGFLLHICPTDPSPVCKQPSGDYNSAVIHTFSRPKPTRILHESHMLINALRALLLLVSTSARPPAKFGPRKSHLPNSPSQSYLGRTAPASAPGLESWPYAILQYRLVPAISRLGGLNLLYLGQVGTTVLGAEPKSVRHLLTWYCSRI